MIIRAIVSYCQGKEEAEEAQRVVSEARGGCILTEILHSPDPPMPMPDMLIPDAVAVALDIALSIVFVAIAIAAEVVVVVVIMSIAKKYCCSCIQRNLVDFANQ